jgi:hypothetical protein
MGAYSLQKTVTGQLHRGKVSLQTKSIPDSIIVKSQRAFSNGVYSSRRPIWIGLADVSKPTSAHCRLNFITQCINSLGDGIQFLLPDMIRDPEVDKEL